MVHGWGGGGGARGYKCLAYARPSVISETGAVKDARWWGIGEKGRGWDGLWEGGKCGERLEWVVYGDWGGVRRWWWFFTPQMALEEAEKRCWIGATERAGGLGGERRVMEQ